MSSIGTSGIGDGDGNDDGGKNKVWVSPTMSFSGWISPRLPGGERWKARYEGDVANGIGTGSGTGTGGKQKKDIKSSGKKKNKQAKQPQAATTIPTPAPTLTPTPSTHLDEDITYKPTSLSHYPSTLPLFRGREDDCRAEARPVPVLTTTTSEEEEEEKNAKNVAGFWKSRKGGERKGGN